MKCKNNCFRNNTCLCLRKYMELHLINRMSESNQFMPVAIDLVNKIAWMKSVCWQEDETRELKNEFMHQMFSNIIHFLVKMNRNCKHFSVCQWPTIDITVIVIGIGSIESTPKIIPFNYPSDANWCVSLIAKICDEQIARFWAVWIINISSKSKTWSTKVPHHSNTTFQWHRLAGVCFGPLSHPSPKVTSFQCS